MSNSKVKYVENKPVNNESIQRLLSVSANANHWTNFGPLSHQLEDKLSNLLSLDDHLRVVVCCNATVALHTLVAMEQTLAQKELRWATSAFGFYSSADGILNNAQIVDSDANAMLNLKKVDPEKIDGIIATNVFGQMTDMESYREYAKAHKKALIIDSAMAFHSGNHIPNEIISLHHTKPWGFGEGGCAIVHKDNEKLFRSLISFGHDTYEEPINRLAINGKISDISCAFILMWLEQITSLKNDYNEQYQRIVDIGLQCGLSVLADNLTHPGIPANVPLLLPKPKKLPQPTDVPFARYYHPLADRAEAWNIYNRILNIPCHRDLSQVSEHSIKNAVLHILSLPEQ